MTIAVWIHNDHCCLTKIAVGRWSACGWYPPSSNNWPLWSAVYLVVAGCPPQLIVGQGFYNVGAFWIIFFRSTVTFYLSTVDYFSIIVGEEDVECPSVVEPRYALYVFWHLCGSTAFSGKSCGRDIGYQPSLPSDNQFQLAENQHPQNRFASPTALVDFQPRGILLIDQLHHQSLLDIVRHEQSSLLYIDYHLK